MSINNYLVLDIENNSSNRYKRKAGNFLYDKIVAVGLSCEELGSHSYYIDAKVSEQQFDVELEDQLKDYSLLVGHNLKHDLLFLWKYTAVQNWLKAGGKIWDTAQVEYILTGQEHQYPALRDIAVNKYGCKEREKKMEDYWDKGVQTSDIPKELVLEDVQNDVKDTETIFLKQYQEVTKRNIHPLIETENDMLLFSTELEYNGMYIDPHILKATKYDLEQKLEQKREQLTLIIDRVWK